MKKLLTVLALTSSLALALGGMREGFTLPALADGFATFAGGGIYAPSGLIARVEDDKGRVLYSNSPAGQRVFSEDVCCIMNDMLQTAVRELGLEGVNIVNARAEELGRDPAFRERYDAVIARAVAPLASLAEYCMPFVKAGGRFVAWKGSADELETGRRALSLLGGGTVLSVGYELPGGYGARTLIVAEKKKPTPAQYPRGNGKERKNPL